MINIRMVFAVLIALSFSAIAHGQTARHWEVLQKTSDTLSLIDETNDARHWENRLTTSTWLVGDKFHEDPNGEGLTTTYHIKYNDGSAPWPLFENVSILVLSRFRSGQAFILTEGGKGSNSLHLLDLRSRRDEPHDGMGKSFFIDSERNLYAYVDDIGQIFLNRSRVFPEPLLDIHFRKEYPFTYLIENGKETTVPAESVIAQGYFAESAVTVDANMEIEAVVLKSRIGRPTGPFAPPYFPKDEDRQYFLIHAHPANPDPEAPGKWSIKRTELTKDEATSISRSLNEITAAQLRKVASSRKL